MAKKRSATTTKKTAGRSKKKRSAKAASTGTATKKTSSKKTSAKKTSAKKSSTQRTSKKKRATKPRKPNPAELERTQRVYQKLEQTYPDAECALKHRNAYELLTATILSAQCTDERVNKTTPELFAAYPTPKDLAESDPEDVQRIIRSCGFYKSKTRSIRSAAQDIVNKHGGEVPATMEELVNLHGVARKTANVILETAFGINEGVVVDTHVKRLSTRLGFTRQNDPNKIEQDLMARFQQPQWGKLAHMLIWHGRRICIARKPHCARCPLQDDCPRIGVTQSQ